MNNKRSSIGFMGLLQIVFIVLKLCGVIHWTWFWVLSPFWLEIIIIVIATIIITWLRR